MKQSENQKAAVSIRLLAGISAVCLLPVFLWAATPGWWTARNVTTGGTANDYAVANQGQLKNIATAAYNELQTNLPGGVGDMTAPSGTFPGGTGWRLTNLISSWGTATSGTQVEITGSNTNDYAVVNLGQLKLVASLFYNRLIEVNYTHQYPWTSSTNAPNDYAVANIGQVKNLFNFDVTYSSAGVGGIPDWWEMYYFGGIGQDPAAPAFSGNGLTILQCYQQALNPVSFYSGQTPTLAYVSGSNQAALPGTFLPAPLVVYVTGSGGSPWSNAPVDFWVTQGGGLVSGTNTTASSPSNVVQVYTGSSGTAQVYYQEPSGSGTQSVRAFAANGTPVQITLANGLTVGEWKFDDASDIASGTTIDSSGYGNSGTLNNGVYWTPSFDGSGALWFDGVSGYVSVNDSASLEVGTGPVTITAWVRLASGLAASTDDYNIVYKGNPTADGFLFALQSGSYNGLVAQVFNNGNPQQIIPSTDQSALLSDGNWHHVAFVRDASGNGALYIDGTSVGTQSGMTASISGSAQPLWIGSGSGAGYFSGVIDHVIIGKMAVTSGNINAAYNQDSDGNGLPDWWEYEYFGSIGQVPSAPAPVGDGLTILQAYQEGVNPNALLILISGNNQAGVAGAFTPASLVVEATDVNGNPATNAAVTFDVDQGGGVLSATNTTGATTSGTLTVLTGSNGTARVYYQEPTGAPVQSLIDVSAGNAGVEFSTSNDPLLADWEFEEGSGTTAYDSSDYGNNGTLTGSVNWTSSFDGSGAIQLDGSSGYVAVPDSPSLEFISGTGPVTLMAWIQVASGTTLTSGSATTANILYKGTAAGNGFQFALQGGSSSNLVATIFNSGSAQQIVSGSEQGAVLSDGNWHHVAYVNNGSGNGTLYIDGSSAATQGGMTATMSSTQALSIGVGESGSGYFNGTMDHVIIEQTMLSGSDIAAAYNQDTDGGGLPDWWQYKYFGSIGQDPDAPATGQPGLTLLQAYQDGLDPVDFYNGRTPGLAIISGTNQVAFPGSFLPAPLVVQVTGTNGSPLNNAPVTFSVSQGGGLVSSTNISGSTLSGSLQVSSGTNGYAQVYYQEPVGDATQTVTVTAGDATVQFTPSSSTVVGDWTFDDESDGTSGTTIDSSGYGNTGTLNNGVSGTSSFDDTGALSFDGISGYVSVNDSASLALGSGPVTITAWVQLSQLAPLVNGTIYNILYKGTAVGMGFQFALEGGADNGLIMQIFDNGITEQLIPSTNQSALLSDGNWHLVAFVRDQSGVGTLYIDGIAVGTRLGITDSMTSGSGQPLLMGVGENGGYFNGTIDHVIIQKSTESAANIAAEYNQDSTGNGLPDWWQYEQFGYIGVNPNAPDPGDSEQTIFQKYQNYLNQNNYYNGFTPTLTVISGSAQTNLPGTYLPSPLVVQVTGTSGSPLANAPVTFTVNQGGGLVSGTNTDGSPVWSSLQVLSSGSGYAQVYYLEPSGSSAQSVSVTAGDAAVQIVLPNGTTVGEWKFDDTADILNGTTCDTSGYNNTGTLEGEVTPITSFDGSGALLLDGSSGCVQVANSASLGLGTGPATVTAWVKLASGAPLSSGTDVYNVVYKGESSGGGFQFAVQGGTATPALVATIFNGGTPQQVVSGSGAGVFADGNWHHVGFVKDGSGNGTLYIDGTAVGTQSGMSATMSSTDTLYVGKGGSGGYFDGAIDHVIIQEAAENASTMAALYNQDSDDNGLPDWWEYKYFGATGQNPAAPAPSGNGLTILQSYHDGVSPVDYYNGQLPSLSVFSGTAQSGYGGIFLPGPLVVQVLSGTTPLANAPVTFTTGTAGGSLSTDAVNLTGSTCTVRTGSNGLASVYFQLPVGSGSTATVAAAVVSGTQSAQVMFSESVQTFPKNGLQLWLESGTGITLDEDGNVQTWADQSGTTGHLSGSLNSGTETYTGGGPAVIENTLNGYPVVDFNDEQTLNLPDFISSGTAGEIIAVLKSGSLDPYYYPQNGLWQFGTASGAGYYLPGRDPSTGGYPVQMYDDFGSNNSVQEGTPPSDVTQYHVYEVSSSQTGSWQSWINSVPYYSTTGNSVAFTNSPVLGMDGQGYPFFGDIAEILVYNRTLNASERQAVNAYLSNKYGIGAVPQNPTIDLPAEATYSSPPTATITCSTPGTSIYYTTDGNAPSAGVPDTIEYTGPFTIRDSTVLKAIAVSGTTPYQSTSGVTTVTVNIDASTANVPRIGMEMWLKADSLSGSGSIPVWADQSGSGNDAAQSDSANQPTYQGYALNGMPAVQFNGSSQYLNLSAALNSGSALPQTLIIVTSGTGAASGSMNPDGAFDSAPNTPGSFRFYQDDFELSGTSGASPSVALSMPNIGSVTSVIAQTSSSGTRQMTVYQNSTLLGSGTGNSSPVVFQSGQLGRLNLPADGDMAYFNGNIEEVLLYNRPLDSAELLSLTGYFMNKYGVGLPPAPSPVIGVASGSYSTAQSVTLSTGNLGDIIYYTIDGSMPAMNASDTRIYYTPITISGSATITAITYRANYGFSAPTTATIVIDPNITVVTGSNQPAFPLMWVPLIVKLTNQSGQPITGGSVTFTAQSGLYLSNTPFTYGQWGGDINPYSTVTDTNGNAEVYVYQPADSGSSVPSVTVTAGVSSCQVTPLDGITVGDWITGDYVSVWYETIYVADMSGFNNYGLTSASAVVGSGSSFDGTDDLIFDGSSAYVNVPDSSSLALGSGPATMDAWIRLSSGTPLSSGTDVYNIVYKGETSGNGFQLAVQGGTSAPVLVATLFNSGSAQQVVSATTASSVFGDGDWHNVGFVRDASGNGTLYIDGSAAGTQSGMSATMTSTEPLYIGAGQSGGYFKGAIDHVVVQAVAETGSNMLSAYNQETGYNPDYWYSPTGVPDWWAFKYFNTPDINTGSICGDGLTVLQEYQDGRDPLGGVGNLMLSVVSGSDQAAASGSFAYLPLVVRLDDGSGNPISSGTITFAVNQGGGGLATASGSATSGTLAVVTGTNGKAQVWYQEPDVSGTNSLIVATAGDSPPAQFFTSTKPVLADWEFETAGSGTALDSSVYGNNGILTGGASINSGSSFDGSGALWLDGSTGYACAADNPSLDFASGTGPLTVTAWVQLASPAIFNSGSTTTCNILYKGAAAGNGIQFAVQGSGSACSLIATIFNNGSAQQISSGTVAGVLFTGTASNGSMTWHQVAFTRNTTGVGTLYIDGSSAATQTGMNATVSSTQALWIGKGESGGYFNGNMDEVTVENVALSGSAIAASILDSDGSGLSDAWEWQYFQQTGLNPNTYVPSGAGDTLLQAYQQHINPFDYYNGITPTINIISGSNQTGPPGMFAPLPLVVQVTNGSGTPLVNAPVSFVVVGGVSNGFVGTESYLDLSGSLVLRTDTNGFAAVRFLMSSSDGTASQITAEAFTSGTPSQTFTETASSSSSGGGSGSGSGSGSGDNTPPPDPWFGSFVHDDGSVIVFWTDNSNDPDGTQIQIQQPDGTQKSYTAPAGQYYYLIPAQ